MAANNLFSTFGELILGVSLINDRGVVNKTFQTIYIDGGEFDVISAGIHKSKKRYLFDNIIQMSTGEAFHTRQSNNVPQRPDAGSYHMHRPPLFNPQQQSNIRGSLPFQSYPSFNDNGILPLWHVHPPFFDSSSQQFANHSAPQHVRMFDSRIQTQHYTINNGSDKDAKDADIIHESAKI